LLVNEAQPRGEIVAPSENLSSADRGHDGAESRNRVESPRPL